MDDLIASYRVSVRPYSKIKYIQHTLLVCWYCLVVYFWPYFIPTIIKFILVISFLLLGFFTFYPAKVAEKKAQSKGGYEVFQLSEFGQVYWVKSSRTGQLLATSYFWPFCFYLRIINPISQKCYWKVIFVDQVSDDSARRLRRIIKRIKST